MSWSQDITTCVLFPYLIPSLSVCKEDCWSKGGFRSVLEYLLICFCNISFKKTQQVLGTFMKRTLSVSPYSSNKELNKNFSFLVNIEERSSFKRAYKWRFAAHSFYACSALIEHKASVSEQDNIALEVASEKGHNLTVALLLEYKADVHASGDAALRRAIKNGHKQVVSLLLEYKADVGADVGAPDDLCS
jgi:hypothetical protein